MLATEYLLRQFTACSTALALNAVLRTAEVEKSLSSHPLGVDFVHGPVTSLSSGVGHASGRAASNGSRVTVLSPKIDA